MLNPHYNIKEMKKIEFLHDIVFAPYFDYGRHQSTQTHNNSNIPSEYTHSSNFGNNYRRRAQFVSTVGILQKASNKRPNCNPTSMFFSGRFPNIIFNAHGHIFLCKEYSENS